MFPFSNLHLNNSVLNRKTNAHYFSGGSRVYEDLSQLGQTLLFQNAVLRILNVISFLAF